MWVIKIKHKTPPKIGKNVLKSGIKKTICLCYYIITKMNLARKNNIDGLGKFLQQLNCYNRHINRAQKGAA